MVFLSGSFGIYCLVLAGGENFYTTLYLLTVYLVPLTAPPFSLTATLVPLTATLVPLTAPPVPLTATLVSMTVTLVR